MGFKVYYSIYLIRPRHSSLADHRPQLVGLLSFGGSDKRLDKQRQCWVSHRCEQVELKSYACKGETISPIDHISEYFQNLGKAIGKKTHQESKVQITTKTYVFIP